MNGALANVAVRHVRSRIEDAVNQLDSVGREISRLKEQLRVNRSKAADLESEYEHVNSQLENSTENKTVFDRLIRTKEKIRTEMEVKFEKEKIIKANLGGAELNLEVLKLEFAPVFELEEKVTKEENDIQMYNSDLGHYRMLVEQRTAENAISRIRNSHSVLKTRIEKAEEDEKMKYIAAKKSRVELSNIMNDTSKKFKDKEQQIKNEEIDEQKRMKESALTLKNNLDQNDANLYAESRRKSANRKKYSQNEEKELQTLEESGLTAEEAKSFLEQKRKHSKRQKQYENAKMSQDQRKVEIVQKILKEEEYLKREKMKNPGVFESVHLTQKVKVNPVQMSNEMVTNSLGRVKALQNYRSYQETPKKFENEDEIREVENISNFGDYFQPIKREKNFGVLEAEFEDLWTTTGPDDNENYQPSTKKKEKVDLSFAPNPKVIQFLDFEVGKCYKKALTLTNFSQISMAIRLRSISDNLVDFINYEFENKTALSPGMSTKFIVTFHPACAEPIHGEVTFFTEAGILTVPIECSPPMVNPHFPAKTVEFGKQTIGEIIEKTIKIENHGALDGELEIEWDYDLGPESELKIKIGDVDFSKQLYVDFKAKSFVEITLIFTPLIPWILERNLKLKIKSKGGDITEENLLITGEAEPVKVTVSKNSFDLQVCTFGFLYQEQFFIKNTGSIPQMFNFQIPKEFNEIIQIFPTSGYVQPNSETKIQVKFQPMNKNISEKFLDFETMVLEIPVKVKIFDQRLPLEIIIFAILNDQDVEVSTTNLDFGNCTIFESVVQKIQLKNKSLLVENIGFLDLPKNITIRPNNGFISILPNETFAVEIIYSPTKAGENKFKIVMESLRGVKKQIACKATAVHPPLDLTSRHLEFITTLNDEDRNCFSIFNPHTDGDEFTHPVPRIGNGPVFPVGPTSFAFMPLEEFGLFFSPSVGTLKPGESQQVTVTFNPTLSDEEISAVWKQRRSSEAPTPKSRVSTRMSKSAHESRVVTPVDPKSTDLFWSVKENLIREYKGSETTVKVPCFITPDDIKTGNNYRKAKYNTENCLWLDVKLTIKRPQLVVIGGRQVINHEDIPVTGITKKSIWIMNIFHEKISLKSSLLDPVGPFVLVNNLPDNLAPGAKFQLIFHFMPQEGVIYHDFLQLKSFSEKAESGLKLTLRGLGLSPIIEINGIEERKIKFETNLVGTTSEFTFNIENKSSFNVDYNLFLDSENSHTFRGNISGKMAFDASPKIGSIAPNTQKEIKASFTSDNMGIFTDKLRIRLFKSFTDVAVLDLYGRSSLTSIFIDDLNSDAKIIYSDETLGAGSGFTGHPNDESTIDGGPIILEMIQSYVNGFPEWTGSFTISQIISRIASGGKKGKKESKKLSPKSQFLISAAKVNNLRIFPDSKGQIDSDIEVIIKCDEIPEEKNNSTILTFTCEKTLTYQLILHPVS